MKLPQGYESHPAADIFPMLGEEELAALAADIKANGQQEAILFVNEGRRELILDGRNRLLACLRAGVEPKFSIYEGDDPIGRVVSLNMHRRHLTPSQRSMAAQRARALYDAAAKERQGTRTDQHCGHVSTMSRARDEVGAVFGVSGRHVDRARRVMELCDEDTVKAVDHGDLTVTAALREAKVATAKPVADRRLAEITPKPDRKMAPKPDDDCSPQEVGLAAALWYLKRARSAFEKLSNGSLPGAAADVVGVTPLIESVERRLAEIREVA